MRSAFAPPSLALAIAIFAIAPSPECGADYTLYTIPGTTLTMLLEGSVTHNPGGTATHRHPRGNLYFSSRDIQILKAPNPRQVYASKLRAAKSDATVEAFLELSKWALHNGMLDESNAMLSAAWKIDPAHEKLRKLAGLMQYLNRPVPASPDVEARGRELVGGRAMQASRSDHFILLHDGDGELDPVSRKTRAQMRLELLEKVFHSYFRTFAFEGLYLKPPTEPLLVVLFSKHADFMQLEKRLKVGLRNVAGFYLPEENISIFYDSGTSPTFQSLMRLSMELEDVKEEMRRTRAPGGGELIRLANTLQLLVDIERESEDVATVSHEALHHIAGNTDLFPHDGVFVRWIHEGLASFFESAKLARWSGVGVVDSSRIGYYRALEGDPVRGSVEFIVSDLGFAIEGLLGDQLPAYGQAWALTHFLFNEHFDKLIDFYRRVQTAELPEPTSKEAFKERSEKLLSLFDEVFGDRVTLELEWRRYMRNLRTDTERLVEELER